MSGFNKVIVSGNLGGDAELRHIPNGDPLVEFSVGANESWKDSKGNKKERCEWFRCTLFGKRAEALAQYLTKGSRVLVEGKLRTDTYEKNGETKYSTKVIVSDVVLLGGGKRDDDDDDHESDSRKRYGDGDSKPKSNGGGAGGRRQQTFGDAEPDQDPFNGAETDEIPF